MDLRERGIAPGLVEQEARGIFNTALEQQQAISYVFDLKKDPLGLGQYGNDMLEFFLLKTLTLDIRKDTSLNAHVSELPQELSDTIDRLLKNKEPKLPDKVKNYNGLGLILEPVQEIASELAATYPFDLPLSNKDKDETLDSLRSLADKYKERVKEYDLETLIQKRPIEKVNPVRVIVPFVLAGLSLVFLGTRACQTTADEKESRPKPSPTAPPAELGTHDVVSPRPLGVPPHTNGHSVSPIETATPPPAQPEQDPYVAYAEYLLSSPIPGASELNPPSHRESLEKIGGVKMGEFEKTNPNGWRAKAGKNGVKIANLPVPLPSLERIETDQEVRGLAEIQTKALDGTIHVYWLLFGETNSQPRYAHIATVNPDGSLVLHIDEIPEGYFTKES